MGKKVTAVVLLFSFLFVLGSSDILGRVSNPGYSCVEDKIGKKVSASALLISFLFGSYDIAFAAEPHKKVIEGHQASPGETSLSTSTGKITVKEACEFLGTAAAISVCSSNLVLQLAYPLCQRVVQGPAGKVCEYCTDGNVGHAVECIGLALAIIALIK